MKVYINWENQEVVTEMQLETVIEEEIEKLESNKDDFAFWLNNHFSAYEIWNMNDDNLLDGILDGWHECCADRAEQYISNNFDEYDLPNA